MIKNITTKLKNKVETHKDEIIGCVLISVSMIIAYKNGRDDGGIQVLKMDDKRVSRGIEGHCQ